MSGSLVIIPTYNEKENIKAIVPMVMELSDAIDVLVVDDASPDGTASEVKALQQRYPERLHLLQRSGKLGLGTAYIAGFQWGLTHGYDFLFEMDADLSHPPKTLLPMIDELAGGHCDVVIGSRYCKGGKVKDWPWDRIVLSYGASLYTRLITWMPVKDPTAGFIGYTRKVLMDIPLDRIRFVGYAFQIEMKFSAHLRGYRFREVPITFVDRVAGQSKLSSGIIHEAVIGVIVMRWKSLFQPYP